MKNIETQILIKAPAKKVWKILTDLGNYRHWNPFITKSEGVVEKGEKITNTMQLEGRSAQVFTPEITEVKPGKSFRWLGSLFVKGLFDGEHYFEVVPVDQQETKLIHGENFRGILVNLILKMIGSQTREGFEKMNEALKREAENQNP